MSFASISYLETTKIMNLRNSFWNILLFNPRNQTITRAFWLLCLLIHFFSLGFFDEIPIQELSFVFPKTEKSQSSGYCLVPWTCRIVAYRRPVLFQKLFLRLKTSLFPEKKPKQKLPIQSGSRIGEYKNWGWNYFGEQSNTRHTDIPKQWCDVWVPGIPSSSRGK